MTTAKKYINSQDIRGGVWLAIDRWVTNLLNPAAGRTVTGSTTLALTDVNGLVRANSGSAIVLTIPNDTTVAWSGDTIVSAYQQGAGTVSFAAGSGVTLRSPSGIPASVQYGVASVLRVGANEWTLV